MIGSILKEGATALPNPGRDVAKAQQKLAGQEMYANALANVVKLLRRKQNLANVDSAFGIDPGDPKGWAKYYLNRAEKMRARGVPDEEITFGRRHYTDIPSVAKYLQRKGTATTNRAALERLIGGTEQGIRQAGYRAALDDFATNQRKLRQQMARQGLAGGTTEQDIFGDIVGRWAQGRQHAETSALDAREGMEALIEGQRQKARSVAKREWNIGDTDYFRQMQAALDTYAKQAPWTHALDIFVNRPLEDLQRYAGGMGGGMNLNFGGGKQAAGLFTK